MNSFQPQSPLPGRSTSNKAALINKLNLDMDQALSFSKSAKFKKKSTITVMDTQSGHSQCPLSQKSRLKTASIHIEDLDGVVSSTTCQLQPLAALFGVLSSFAHALPPTQPLDDKSVALAAVCLNTFRPI